jgi:Cation/multidrug efflux pump
VFAGEALTDPRALANVAITDHSSNTTVPLGRLGKVTLGDGPATQQASFDGQHAVLLSAYPIIGADAVSLRHNLDARIPSLTDGIPDVHVTRYWDQTRLISASQESLRDSILIGALLALIVIYVFLRSFGITFGGGRDHPRGHGHHDPDRRAGRNVLEPDEPRGSRHRRRADHRRGHRRRRIHRPRAGRQSRGRRARSPSGAPPAGSPGP